MKLSQELHDALKQSFEAKAESIQTEQDLFGFQDWYFDCQSLWRTEGSRAMLNAFGVDGEKFGPEIKGKKEALDSISDIHQEIFERKDMEIKGLV